MLIVSLIILQLIIFGVLIFIFRRIMSQNVVSATQHLDELSKDYAEKENKVNREIEEVKQKARELMVKAQEEAENLKAEIIKRADDERDNIIKQARVTSEEIIKQADKSRKQLLSEVDEMVAKEAIKKACELIQDTLPEQFKQIVHTQWVEDLIDNGFRQTERLHIPEGTLDVKVSSAFALTDEQRKKISKKLKDSLNRDVAFEVEIDPKIVAGLVISIGSLVLDGSLKSRIQEKTR